MNDPIYLQNSWDFQQTENVVCPFCSHNHDSDIFYHGGEQQSSHDSDTYETWIDCESCTKQFSCTLDRFNQCLGFSSAPIACEKLMKKHNLKFAEHFTDKAGVTFKKFGCKLCWHKDYKELDDHGKILNPDMLEKRYRSTQAENQPAEEGKTAEISLSDARISISTKTAIGNREIYLLVLNELKKLGYKIGQVANIQKNYPSLNFSHSYGICSGLEFEAHYYPAGMAFEFFQNVHPGERKKGEGQYEFSKLKYMPYLMLKRLELSKQKIINCLETNSKYNIKLRVEDLLGCHNCPNLNGLTNEETVARLKQYPKDLSREHVSNLRDGDGTVMANQDLRYSYIDGILVRGEVYYSLNCSWYLLTDKNFYCCQAGDLFTFKNQPVKKSRVKEQSLKIMQRELDNNIKISNFEKCIILRDLITKK